MAFGTFRGGWGLDPCEHLRQADAETGLVLENFDFGPGEHGYPQAGRQSSQAQMQHKHLKLRNVPEALMFRPVPIPKRWLSDGP